MRWGIVLVVGIVLAVIIYTIRNLPVTFGLHTVVAILLIAIFIIRSTKTPSSTSFLAVFFSFAVLFLLETLMNKVFIIILNIKISKLISDDTLWTLTGLPQSILLIVIALLISRYREPLEGMWKI
ncbi:hypothetical protein DCCM_2514 [Desulfocucumis palustris]|uniref:Uncharacterized protein n=1 Tax=Desulfocucumis palustris TaxID=1898651 RepID=A0A2L2XCI5_9FIRM|nr:hypothetical protein DCCM_2514 [Desulfocucumis palustris]